MEFGCQTIKWMRAVDVVRRSNITIRLDRLQRRRKAIMADEIPKTRLSLRVDEIVSILYA